MFLVQTSIFSLSSFRVLSVAESEDGIYGVSAIAYNSTIYDAVESDVELTTRDISNLSVPRQILLIAFITKSFYEDRPPACLLVR